jgi:hypothetical protein
MSSPREYHNQVKRSILAPVATFGLLLLFVSASYTQVNGVPSSVTSPGFGGRAVNAPPASVTSLGPNGYGSNHVQFRTTVPANQRRNGDHDRGRHRRSETVPYYYAVPVAVPYASDAANDAYNDDESDYQGGPTIFDRRGSGPDAYVPPVRDPIPAHAHRDEAQAVADPPAPEPPQEPTLLAFKDGRKLEVGNYAIVGQTLFDLTPGHARKVALADLDLDATQRLNDDRGVTFQLPPSAQAN